MNTHKLFAEFDKKIRLTNTKKDGLKTNGGTLRGKIRSYFKDKGWRVPVFYRQGSYPLNTNLNPIEGGEYDLDDGVYFICLESNRETPSTYHARIKEAVDGHAKDVVDKTVCVRVVYADGHHVDLPCYWMSLDGDIPQLAHKSNGFIESDPKAFKDWVHDKISQSNSNGQLQRIIRYFKAWMDHQESCNSNLKLASGFIWTILVCEHFQKNDRDDLAFKNVAEAIQNKLNTDFSCYRPTTPTDEDLLDKYLKDTLLGILAELVECVQEAINASTEVDSAKCWRKIFGDRFPKGKTPNSGGKTSIIAGGSMPTVAATKPFCAAGVTKEGKAAQIKITDESIANLQEILPNLEYSSKDKAVCGDFSFCSKYSRKKNGSWEIISASAGDTEGFEAKYSFKIDLTDPSRPKVYETSGKVKETAEKLNKELIDLHMFDDSSCCLDFMSARYFLDLDIYQFVVNKVYPYFAWQAYYQKFEKCPPCGEHSHNPDVAATEFNIDFSNMRRNDRCICGSGRKFKDCHGSSY